MNSAARFMSPIMKRTLLSRSALTLTAVGVCSCSDITGTQLQLDSDAGPDAARVVSIAVILASSTIAPGASTQASVTLVDSRNRTVVRDVIWSSGSPGVATVSSSGVVLGVAEGTSVITASRGGVSGSATVVVSSGVTTTSTPVASVTVTLASNHLVPGASTQATATTYDASGNVLSGRAVDWSSSDSAIARVNSSGVVTAVSAGVVQVTASSEGKTGVATLTVDTPTSSGPSAEPVGMTPISDRPFNSVTTTYTRGEDGWWDFGGNALTVTTDASAPRSAPNVGRLLFPAGFAGGNSPGGSERVFPGAQTLYVSMWLKFSDNWQSHPIANKVNHIWVNGVNRIFSCTVGPGGTTGSMSPQFGLQQLADIYDPITQSRGGYSSGLISPNIPGQENISLVRGRWYRWEMVLTAGTPGGADGTVDWWIDGVKVGHYAHIPFVAAGGDNHWTDFQWNPTWGGLGSTVSSNMYMYMDNIYISTKP